MTKQQLLINMKAIYACGESVEWVKKQTGNAQQIWDSSQRGDWLLWYASQFVDRKTLVSAACLVAREALVYVPAGKNLSLLAIETAERWTSGDATLDEVRAAADEAASEAAPHTRSRSLAAADASAAAIRAADSAYATHAAAAAADAAVSAADAAVYAAAYAAIAARYKSLARSADLVRTLVREVPL